MKRLIMILIIILYISPVLADKIEWVDPQEKILRMNQHVLRDNYIIEASDFYENEVLITVYRNHTMLARNITRAGDSMVVGDINITILDIERVRGNIGAMHGLNVTIDQWVKIQTKVVGRPAPIVSIMPYERQEDNKTIVRHVFSPGDEILMNFSISNEGKAVLKNVSLRINSTLPLLSGEKLNYDLEDFRAEDTKVITVGFKAPLLKERKSFSVSAELRGNDVLGRAYQVVDSTYVKVIPQVVKTREITLRKYVSERVYMGDIGVVTISIKNNMGRELKAILNDTLPSGIIALNTKLMWNLTLKPHESTSITYTIKPQKPGVYIFPAGSAKLMYDDVVVRNRKSSRMVVSGPYVVLKKSVNKLDVIVGENITITTEAMNMGDTTAIVRLRDEVPANYTLSDTNSTDIIKRIMILRPGRRASISYVLNTTTSGSFVLPPAKALIHDQFLYLDERYTYKAVSNTVVINVSNPIMYGIESKSISGRG